MENTQRGGREAALAPERAHLVRIAEKGMSGLAQLLVERGLTVTGSDLAGGPTVDRLRQMGIRVHAGHAAGYCPSQTEILIFGPQIGREDSSRLAASRRGITQISSARWLDQLIGESIGVVVAGQRHAGVASAMAGWTLTRAGLDPTVVLGNRVPQLGGWARVGSGPHLVVDAVLDSDGVGPRSPRFAIIFNGAFSETNPPVAAQSALRRFASSVPCDGLVLAFEGSDFVGEAVRDLASVVEGFSLRRGSTWWGGDLREERGRYRFRAYHRGRFAVEVRLQVPGRRNVLSALAAVALCGRLDVPTAEVKQGLEEFAGLARDFESRGSFRGVTLVDDEGRDPASIAENLAIGRQVFGGRRLWAVYCVGREVFQDVDRYVAAFAGADRVVIIEGATEAGRCRESESLSQSLVAAGIWARQVRDFDEAIRDLDRQLEPGDVLVTLGAGDVGMIANAFIRRLSRDRQGR